MSMKCPYRDIPYSTFRLQTFQLLFPRTERSGHASTAVRIFSTSSAQPKRKKQTPNPPRPKPPSVEELEDLAKLFEDVAKTPEWVPKKEYNDLPETHEPNYRPSTFLPQSPFLKLRFGRDPRYHKPKSFAQENEGRRHENNPWATALASPIRMCMASGTRLPRDLLEGWGLFRNPETQGLWLLPRRLSAAAFPEQDIGSEPTDFVEAIYEGEAMDIEPEVDLPFQEHSEQHGPLLEIPEAQSTDQSVWPPTTDSDRSVRNPSTIIEEQLQSKSANLGIRDSQSQTRRPRHSVTPNPQIIDENLAVLHLLPSLALNAHLTDTFCSKKSGRGNNTSSGAVGQMIPFRWKGGPRSAITSKEATKVVWRADMVAFMLKLMRMRSLNNLRNLVRGNGKRSSKWILTAIKQEQALDLENVKASGNEALLWFGQQGLREAPSAATTPGEQAAKSPVAVAAQSPLDAIPEAPPDFAKSTSGYKIPIFNVPALLGGDFDSELAELRNTYKPFRSEWVLLKPKGSASISAVLDLWKLMNYQDYEPGTLQGVKRTDRGSREDAEDLEE